MPEESVPGNHETRFRALTEVMGDWVWEVDDSAIFTYSNSKVCELLGYAPEEIIGKKLFDLIVPDEVERVAAKFARVTRKYSIFSGLEIINRHKDGHLVAFEISGVPMFDERDEFCGYCGVTRNITKSRQAGSTSRSEDQYYRCLVNSTYAIPWEADFSTLRFTHVGPQAEAILGYPVDAWYEDGFWLEHMHPEDRSWAPQFCDESATRLEDYHFEYRMYTKDGRLLWLRDSVNIVADAGKPTVLRGFMFDITAQKQKEETLTLSQQRLVESQRIAQLGHWDWDIVNGDVYWSDEHYRIVGLEPGQIKPGYEAFLSFIHPDDQEMWKSAVAEAITGGDYNLDHRIIVAGDVVQAKQHEALQKNAQVRYVHGQGKVQFDDAGKPIRMMGTIQDITDRKYIENALTAIADFPSASESQEYYRTCITSLARVYNVRYAFVGLYSDETMLQIQTQAVWMDGTFIDNFSYSLEGTPCDDVLGTGKELIPRDAVELYPDDKIFVDMGIQSYFGAPMVSSSGKKLGLISVFDTDPLEVASWMEPVLGVFAQRIASFIEHKEAEEKLRLSEKELRSIFRDMQDTYYRVDNGGVISRMSESIEKLLGYTVDELLGKNIYDLYLEAGGWRKLVDQLEKENGAVHDVTVALVHKNGSTVWVSINTHYFKDTDGRILGIEGVARDISQHREAELQMKKMSGALEQSADMVMITDRKGIVEYVNPAFESITGYRADEIIGDVSGKLNSGIQSAGFYEKLWQIILNGEVFRDVFVNRKKDGNLYYEEKSITPVKAEDGQITHFVASGHDITERMENEERLSFMAHHDALTKLPNRTLFMDRLKLSLAHARRYSKIVAVLFIDLDRFKNINDTLGHDVGDQMLEQLANRLQGGIRENDTVARLGGDEFAILLNDIVAEQDISQLAKMILLALEQPFTVGDRELFITASIGISLFPSDGEESGTLLKNADIAMYKAKERGKNNYQFYSADMSARAVHRLSMENSLRRALERDEFKLFYQPQINIETNEIYGAEALIRWQRSEHELVPPNDFIPLLEETGLIAEVGYWVMTTACKQMLAWHEAGFTELKMSINISGLQFHARNFIERVEEIVADCRGATENVEMEITESVLMENQKSTISALEALGELGFKIAIDDFGTGYSSLGYLRRFKVDTLKIDQSFVRDVVDDPDDAAITTAIIALAQSLKLSVVAEGVETEQQLAFLKGHGCRFVQGYLFSRPLPVDEFTYFLTSYRRDSRLVKAGI